MSVDRSMAAFGTSASPDAVDFAHRETATTFPAGARASAIRLGKTSVANDSDAVSLHLPRLSCKVIASKSSSALPFSQLCGRFGGYLSKGLVSFSRHGPVRLNMSVALRVYRLRIPFQESGDIPTHPVSRSASSIGY